MKKYHRACGSNRIDFRTFKNALVPFCVHCKRLIEMSEVQTSDSRLSAVTYNGKAFIYGREVK